jgi:hypothetical protein
MQQQVFRKEDLLDHLVGERQQRRRHLDPVRLGRLEVAGLGVLGLIAVALLHDVFAVYALNSTALPLRTGVAAAPQAR